MGIEARVVNTAVLGQKQVYGVPSLLISCHICHADYLFGTPLQGCEVSKTDKLDWFTMLVRTLTDQ